ncbi:barstar family protein [Ignavigranum ruoffiae]|uniref:Barstar (Barnase inhibitor) n=1 Tax=Ignavigranum ruoffiae TaxID=89093 RepID=A0A1H9B373_9LACT|nr:barstar family protein [Ignavigranum ruoffiae]SEP82668.1 Barstar (barnase inhibitor) [Ignavigranum ruoffiae]
MDYIIDGQMMTSREATYEYLIETLQLPDYTGHNLDALWDVLLDLPDLQITFINARYCLDNLGDYGRDLLDLFGDLNFEDNDEVVMYW